MFAQVLTEYGGLDVLHYQEVEAPVPGPGEVRVRVAFAALNPVEWKIRSGAFQHMLAVTFPAILGNEMSGVIDQTAGSGEFQIGDRVAGFTPAGSDAEYVVTTPDRIAKVPATLSLRQAATIPQGVETARRALGLLGIKPGETIVVNGAAGSVGSAAVQLLQGMGATAIGTARPDNHDYLRSLGAVPVEYGDKLLDHLAAAAPGGIDAALDCGAHGFVHQILPILAAGRIITISDFQAVSEGVQLAAGDPHALTADSFESALPLAAQGRFATQIAAEFPLAELPAAQQLSEAGHLRGKILIRVTDLDS